MDNPYDYKIFVGIFINADYIKPEHLMEATGQAIAFAPTVANQGKSQVEWEQWRIHKPQDSFAADIPDEDGVASWNGLRYVAVAKYQTVGFLFVRTAGAVSLVCRALKHPTKQRSMLGLDFGNYPGPPAWRSYTSEAIVMATVVAIRDHLRSTFRLDPAEPVLSMVTGKWLSPDLAGSDSF
jgi:hypothetical protein